MQDLLYPNGTVKAKFFKVLKTGECACKYNDNNTYIVKNRIVYKRV